jgi:hypothetical protein
MLSNLPFIRRKKSFKGLLFHRKTFLADLQLLANKQTKSGQSAARLHLSNCLFRMVQRSPRPGVKQKLPDFSDQKIYRRLLSKFPNAELFCNSGAASTH